MRTALLLCLLAAAASAGCKEKKAEANATMDGTQLFAAACARCHGDDGFGGQPVSDGGPRPRNFHDEEFQVSRSDQDIIATIKNGKNGNMPAFGETFDDQQLKALAQHVRTFDPRGQKR